MTKVTSRGSIGFIQEQAHAMPTARPRRFERFDRIATVGLLQGERPLQIGERTTDVTCGTWPRSETVTRGRAPDSALLARLVESHVEAEHIDAAFAEHAKLATFRVGPDELANGVFGELASLRDAGNL